MIEISKHTYGHTCKKHTKTFRDKLALRLRRHYNNAPVASPAVVMPHALLCKCKMKRKGRMIFFLAVPLSDGDKDCN